jgi:multidrug resistance efflux pump
VRYQLLPVLMFGSAVVAAFWLWGRHFGMPLTVGEVYAVRVDAVAPADGTLAALPGKPLELFDRVDAGQVVARLDDRAAVTALARMQGDLARLRIGLASTNVTSSEREVALQHEVLREARALALDIEKLRLGIVEREGLIETDKAELARLNEQCNAHKVLVERGVEPRMALVDFEMQRDVVQKRIEAAGKAIEEGKAQMTACQERLSKFSASQIADVEKMLAPIREAIAAEEKRVADLRREIQSLEVRAPFAGTITAVLCRPGQTVVAGTHILTIAATQAQYIISYVRQDQRVTPAVGMAVDVRGRSHPRQSLCSTIEVVGPQVEPVPAHQLRDPKTPEWGLPVRIKMPDGMHLKPGELVDVALRPGRLVKGQLAPVTLVPSRAGDPSDTPPAAGAAEMGSPPPTSKTTGAGQG